MTQEEFSDKLMDKLAGELSENEAILFQNNVASNQELTDEFSFFEDAWNSLDDIYSEATPSEKLSMEFYEKLEAQEKKEQDSFSYKAQNFFNQFHLSSVIQTASFSLVLIVMGFVLGGKFSNQNTFLAKNTQPTNVEKVSPTKQAYVHATEKLDFVQSIDSKQAEESNTFTRLKDLIVKETNTNVRLAALNKLNQYYANDPRLKQFLANQFEVEKSTLIQVELLNLMIDNYHTGETIKKMETILVKKQDLNPFVQEKIRKDLPVLRASFVQ